MIYLYICIYMYKNITIILSNIFLLIFLITRIGSIEFTKIIFDNYLYFVIFKYLFMRWDLLSTVSH